MEFFARLKALEISEKFDTKVLFANEVNKLQNILLEMAFEKEFKSITNPQEAKEFLKRLQGLENERVQIGEIIDGKAVPDDTFKKYYDSKFDKLSREYSFSDEDKEKYSYKTQKMKPPMTEEEEKDFINFIIADRVLNSGLGYKFDYEKKFSQQYRVNGFKLRNNIKLIFILDKNKNQLDMFPTSIGVSAEEEKRFYKSIEGIRNIEILKKVISGDIEAEKIDFDPENKVNELIEAKKNKEKAETEKPKGILSKVFERLKNLFKKPSNPMLMSPQNTQKEDMEEEELPAWDMRNWSEEDIEKAKVEAEKDDRKRERDNSEKGIPK